jgi:RNA recognition motif-containing protein
MILKPSSKRSTECKQITHPHHSTSSSPPFASASASSTCSSTSPSTSHHHLDYACRSLVYNAFFHGDAVFVHSILQNLPLSDTSFALLFFFSLLPFSSIPKVSRAVRVEFARGDGRIKRKEDVRRRKIVPCDTLFVVNFSEATTKKQDLEMLFEPFGELMRIDMRKNYAFIQFRTVEQAAKAKEGTDGGRLQQSIITVEFVVRQRVRGARRDEGRGPPPASSSLSSRASNNDRTRYDDRGGGGYERGGIGRGSSRPEYPPAAADDYRRRPSPPRYNDDYMNSPARPNKKARLMMAISSSSINSNNAVFEDDGLVESILSFLPLSFRFTRPSTGGSNGVIGRFTMAILRPPRHSGIASTRWPLRRSGSPKRFTPTGRGTQIGLAMSPPSSDVWK